MVIKVKIPENLNIVELLQAADLEPKANIVDKIAFICYSIHLSAVNHRDYMDDTDRPYFPLSSKILQKYFHDYSKIEKILKDNGVIESDGIYSKGQKSFGFRFSEKYYGQKYREHEIATIGLHNKIQDYLKNDPLPVSPFTKKYLFLKKFWTGNKLKMDVEGAMKWIDASYKSEINFLNYCYSEQIQIKKFTDSYAKIQKNKAICKLTDKMETWKTSVENFNTGRVTFQADDFSKRLHTKLSNLKKELRGFITYEGQQLVSLDIKNSQPYLSLVLFNQDFWRDKAKKDQKLLLYRKVGVDKVKREVRKEISNSIMLAVSSESEAGKGFEFTHFCSLVTSGKLYEHFIEKFKEIGSISLSRDQIKRQFLKYLYHDPKNLEQYKNGYEGVNLIKSIFPNISALFLLLKQPHSTTPLYQFPYHVLTAKESYKFPSQLLQRIESHLVIEIVCKQLNKGNKMMPLFTIHDSVVTTKEFEQLVHDKMIEALKNAIGYEPKIEPDYFTPKDSIIKTEADFKPREITELNDELIALLSEW